MQAVEYESLIASAFDKAIEAFGSPMAAETAREVAERLVGMSAAQRRVALANRHSSSGILTVRALSTLARDTTRRDSRLGLDASRLAVEAALFLPAHGTHRAIVWDTRAEAYARLANALRLAERYEEARATWAQVEAALEKGTDDLLLAAELAQLKSSLARDQRLFDEAARLLHKASALAAQCGSLHLESRFHLRLGLIYLYQQDYLAARAHSLIAAERLDPQRDEEALMGALHNLALALAESGAVRHALVILGANFDRYSRHASPLFQLRLKWTLAKMSRELGDVLAAGAALDDVRRELLHRDLPYDASLASLDLALVYLELGQHGRVRALAEQMLAVFTAKQIPREASAALLLFVEATRREEATAESVSSLLARLRGPLAPAGRSLPPGKFVS